MIEFVSNVTSHPNPRSPPQGSPPVVLIDLHLCVMSRNVFLLYSFFWVTPGILSADVSEHSIFYIFLSGVSRKNTTYKDGTECSETSAHKIQTPGYEPEERIQHSKQGEMLTSQICFWFLRLLGYGEAVLEHYCGPSYEVTWLVVVVVVVVVVIYTF